MQEAKIARELQCAEAATKIQTCFRWFRGIRGMRKLRAAMLRAKEEETAHQVSRCSYRKLAHACTALHRPVKAGEELLLDSYTPPLA